MIAIKPVFFAHKTRLTQIIHPVVLCHSLQPDSCDSFNIPNCKKALAGLIVILSTVCLLLWLLMAPVEVEIDTEAPMAEIRWVSIGNFRIWYEYEWWFSIRLFFFRKTMQVAKIKKKPGKTRATSGKNKQIRKSNTDNRLKKILQVTRTLQIAEWQLAIDSGRFDANARFYYLNFLSCNQGHLFINFQGENFLRVRLKGKPWKIIYVFLQ